MFKPGDKVRCIIPKAKNQHDLEMNKVYTVLEYFNYYKKLYRGFFYVSK